MRGQLFVSAALVVLVAAAGNATVVWLQCTTAVSQMTTAVRRVDGSWSSPVTLSTPGRSIWYPHLAVAASGAAVASWIESDGHVAVVQASVRTPESNDWSRAAQVSSVGADAEDSSPAIDDTGDAVVGFTRDDPAGEIVWAAYKPSAGDWQRAVNLSTAGDYAVDIQVAMRTGGAAVALWNENGEGRLGVWSPSTGAWAQQGPFPLYGVKSLVADSSGDVVAAAWQSGQVMVSELPAGSGTWTTPVAIPSSQPAVLGLRWYFGDRRNAAGASVSHVHRKAGRFAITLVATDAAGHAVTVTRTSVRISPRRS